MIDELDLPLFDTRAQAQHSAMIDRVCIIMRARREQLERDARMDRLRDQMITSTGMTASQATAAFVKWVSDQVKTGIVDVVSEACLRSKGIR